MHCQNQHVMRGMARAGWFVSIALFATLLGHAVVYACEGRDLADGRHAYFMPVLDLAVAALLAGAIAMVLRALSGQRAGLGFGAAPLAHRWLSLAALQIGGFVALEAMEGHRADLAGCAVEALVALLVAVALASFRRLLERCTVMAAAGYLRRFRGVGVRAPRYGASGLASAFALTTRIGIRRFKRPPPIG